MEKLEHTQQQLQAELTALRQQVSSNTATRVQAAASTVSAEGAPAASLDPLVPSQDIPLSGQLVNPFISISHEPDSHIPASIKSKIAKLEYVDLAYLLEGSLDPSKANTYSISLTVANDAENGNLSLKAPGPKRKIESIHAWTDAFLVYTYILLKTHPDRAAQLLVYMRTIRRAASYGGIMAAKTYDIQFRLFQAQCPARSFANVDSELWITYVVGNRNSSGGSSSGGNFRSGSSAGTPDRSQNPKVCFDFNRAKGCTRSNCSYSHICRKCASKTHNSLKCTATGMFNKSTGN